MVKKKELKSKKASKKPATPKAKTKTKKEVVVVSSQIGTGISSRVFDAKTGEFLYSSWINKNLKAPKTNYKKK
jgi:hypothetical protein